MGGETCVKLEKARVRPRWERKIGINSLKGKRCRHEPCNTACSRDGKGLWQGQKAQQE